MSRQQVVIVANGGANIASLQFALQRLDAASSVSADPDEIRAASHVILPGVGAAADAMSRLRQSGLDAVIPALQQPVLGICLGMQLLFARSQEGEKPVDCLGILPGEVREMKATAAATEGDIAGALLGFRRKSRADREPIGCLIEQWSGRALHTAVRNKLATRQ